MMAKKHGQFSLLAACSENPHKTAPVLRAYESTHKTNCTDRRATVELRFGRGLALYLNAALGAAPNSVRSTTEKIYFSTEIGITPMAVSRRYRVVRS